MASDLAQEWISIGWKKNDKKNIYNTSSSLLEKAVIWNTFRMEKYTISTIIYIYEDKPNNYLHGNRFQYVQSQEKQTEPHGSVFVFEEQLQTVRG